MTVHTPILSNSVLVADNDLLLRGLLRAVLTKLGQSVYLAADGVEALRAASSLQPRLVLLDLEMPFIGGLDVCRALRTKPGYQDVPIVILTAHDEDDRRREALGAGATMFLLKPFRPGALMQALSPYLDLSEQATADLRLIAARDGSLLLADGERSRRVVDPAL